MTDAPDQDFDYSKTLFLPKTDFPMRAGLPQKEPEIIARWARDDLYGALRESGKGRPKFVLHDGPPYANGNIHIGHALNKILKDMVVRSQQMAGKDSNYVPGWDCHGLPIEWKVEEEFYRSEGQDEARFLRSGGDHCVPARMSRLRRALDLGAARGIQAARRGRGLGPSLYDDELPAEAQIAREIFKFVANGLLYRGSKPVMWSVVEKPRWPRPRSNTTTIPATRSTWRSRFDSERRRLDCHLDNNAVDNSGQSSDRLIRAASPTVRVPRR